MKRLAFAAVGALGFASLAAAGEHAFKDWIVGCDNLRACTALALPALEAEEIAYLAVKRDGAPEAQARLVLAVWTNAPDAEALQVSLDGKPVADLAPIPATFDGDFVRAEFDAARSAVLLAALANGRSLAVTTLIGGQAGVRAEISLAGSSAALRFMDAAQKRDGGVTALVAKGDKPASAIPAPPPRPVVKAARLAEAPASNPPAGLTTKGEDCMGDLPPLVFTLTGGKRLWGVCLMTGAYNYTYAFHIEDKGVVTPVRFARPDEAATPDEFAGALTNPHLDHQGRALSAFAKGRGIGDCGVAESWAWDGFAMRLVAFTMMNSCRGVSPDDWPVYYVADLE